MSLQIPDNIFTQIMKVMGAPFVEERDLEISFEQVKTLLIQPALLEYYRWFPIETEQVVSVSGGFSIPFPDPSVFSVKDARLTTNLMNYGPTGNALVDERFIQSGGGLYGRGMYGTRNDYGMATARITRRAEMQTLIDRNKTFKWSVKENQKKLTGFSNVAGTMSITWASYSENWDFVAFSQQNDVIKLCQSYILEYFADLRSQQSVPDAPVELNVDKMQEKAETLKTDVYDKWKNFTTPIIQRG